MTARKKEPAVDLIVDLGALKPDVKHAARSYGVTVNEFICDALQSRIRQDREREPHNFTPHGGKHLFGKHTGYEVTKDGKYYPAPTWKEQFDQLFAERAAITNLVNAVVAQSQERLMQVEKQIQKAKDALIDDLGLDAEKPWVYYGNGEYIAEAEVKTEKKKS